MGHDYEKLTDKARVLARDWRNREEGHKERAIRLKVVEDNLEAVKRGLNRFDRRVYIVESIFSQMPKQEARAIRDIMEMPHIQEKSRAYKLGMEIEEYKTFIAGAWRSFGYALEQVEGWEEL